MSYKAESTISQVCECALFINLWTTVCNFLWTRVINIY
jgi:hypothetical protein